MLIIKEDYILISKFGCCPNPNLQSFFSLKKHNIMEKKEAILLSHGIIYLHNNLVVLFIQ